MIIKVGKKAHHFINRYESLRQFTTYFFIGGLSAISDLILLLLFVEVSKLHYLVAASISFITISTIAFFAHKRFTFRFVGNSNKLRYIVFLFTAGSGLLLSIFLLFFIVEVLNIWYLTAAIITKFIVFAWNFLLNKFVTFRKR